MRLMEHLEVKTKLILTILIQIALFLIILKQIILHLWIKRLLMERMEPQMPLQTVQVTRLML